MSSTILLIRPNILSKKGIDVINKIYPPIGLAYLAGSLIEAGHHVEILDMVAENPDNVWDYWGTHSCRGMTDADLVARIKTVKPNIVGLTGLTIQHRRTAEIVALIKKCSPEITVVLGGIHASAIPEYVLVNTKADYIVLGEGESAFTKLVAALEAGKSKASCGVEGIAFREDGEFRILQRGKGWQNIERIPLPARELLRNSVYLGQSSAMPVITSRGCPYSCTFCCIHFAQGRGWRSRPAKEVVDEMESVVKDYGYQTVTISDDAFNIVPDRVIDICSEIARRKLDVQLVIPGGLLISRLTRETLYWLKKAGLVSVALPFEHTDSDIRNKIMKKNLPLGRFEEALEWCCELEILKIVLFVIGIPGENEASLKNMKEYVESNADKMDAVSFYVATPYPGTTFFQEVVSNGYLADPYKNDFLDFDPHECIISTPMLDKEVVNEYYASLTSAFKMAKGPDFPSDFIRRAVRKPNKETIEYLNNVYFAKTRKGS